MYPFTINTMQNVPFDDQSNQYSPLFNSHNQESSNLDKFSSPSSLLQYEDAMYELTWQQLHDLFYQQPMKIPDFQTENDMEDLEIIQEEPTTNQQTKDPRKKGSKADRHSKITTAHGPRDRRMRLSVPIARKFFGLQDLLGFDKASKTIEWLLTQSNSAIEKIIKDLQKTQEKHTCSTNGIANSISSTSECEVISSGVIDQSEYIDEGARMLNGVQEKIVVRHARRTTFDPLAKESRKIARERARRRTMEKRKVQDESKIESLGKFGKGEENWRTENANNFNSLVQYQGMQEVENLSSMLFSSNWNTLAFYNYEQIEEIPIEHEYEGSFWH